MPKRALHPQAATGVASSAFQRSRRPRSSGPLSGNGYASFDNIHPGMDDSMKDGAEAPPPGPGPRAGPATTATDALASGDASASARPFPKGSDRRPSPREATGARFETDLDPRPKVRAMPDRPRAFRVRCRFRRSFCDRAPNTRRRWDASFPDLRMKRFPTSTRRWLPEPVRPEGLAAASAVAEAAVSVSFPEGSEGVRQAVARSPGPIPERT
jgi:hypothetical protein